MPDASKVLVVEDDETIREVLTTTLEEEGYAVRAVTHGREALDVLAGWPADLIVLDLMLPILDGWGFLAERRRLGVAEAVPVVVVSASRRGGTARSVDGVAAVLPKPFALEELLAAVERAIRPPAAGANPTR